MYSTYLDYFLKMLTSVWAAPLAFVGGWLLGGLYFRHFRRVGRFVGQLLVSVVVLSIAIVVIWFWR